MTRSGAETMRGDSSRALPGNIGLLEDGETGALQDRTGALVILEVQSQPGTAPWPGEQRVTAKDVHFGGEQSRQHLSQLGRFFNFDNAQFANGKGDVVPPKNLLHAL